MPKPRLTDRFRPVSFYCQEELFRLVGVAAKRMKTSKSAVFNEALYRYFEPICEACGGTGRARANPVKDQVELVKTLEEFLDKDKKEGHD